MSNRSRVVWAVAVLALLGRPGPGWADDGFWRLVKSEARGLQHRYKTPADTVEKVDSSPGVLRVTRTSFRNPSHREMITEVVMACTWSQPPARSKPDEPWKGGFRTVLERNVTAPGWTVGMGSLKGSVDACHTCYEDASEPEKPVVDHMYSAARTFICVPEFSETHEGEFLFPRSRPGQTRLRVDLLAEALGVSELYSCYYEWVTAEEQPLEVGLRIQASHSLGGVLEGATFRVRDERKGERFELTSSAEGVAQAFRKAAPSDFPLRFTLEEVVLGPPTLYHVNLERPVPASIYPVSPLVVRIDRRLELSREQRLTTTFEYKLPVIELKVSAMSWNQASGRWQPCQARLLVSTDAGRKVLQSEPSIFDRTGVPGLARIYLPAREVLGVARAKVLGLDPATRFNDLRSFDLPAAAGPDPTTVSVTLLLCGLEQKLERISGELFRFFTPLVGEERALRIARVGLVIDPSRAVPSYLDGNIRLPATLDLTRDECCETLMHEWTHHAMAVLANDPEVEGRLGGAHQTWEAAPNRELAWDEARAHFFSVVLTRRLDLPRAPGSFGEASSRGVRQGVAQAGETVEGVGASALLTYYTTLGHRRTEDVVRDFLGTQDAAVASTGHPPRTSREFFAQERQRVEQLRQQGSLSAAESARRLQVLTSVTAEYRINP